LEVLENTDSPLLLELLVYFAVLETTNYVPLGGWRTFV
jgi:hypothetical protein